VETKFQAFSLPRTWVPHISLVFREMWDFTELDSVFFTFSSSLGTLIRRREIQIRGIPHLAKTSEIWGTQVRGREEFLKCSSQTPSSREGY
jgi:hypothetical protein